MSVGCIGFSVVEFKMEKLKNTEINPNGYYGSRLKKARAIVREGCNPWQSAAVHS